MKIDQLLLRSIPSLPDDTSAALAAEAQLGNQKAKETLLRGHMRLVLKICRAYAHPRIDISDLFQEGCLGLCRAITKFDTSKGRFSSYAYNWVEGLIREHVARNAFHGLRLNSTRHGRRAYHGIGKARRLAFTRGQGDDDATVAEILGVSVEEVQIIRTSMAPLAEIVVHEVPTDGPTPEESAERRTFVEAIARRLREMKLSRREVVLLRHMLMEGIETHEEIGRSFGVSKQRVQQLEQNLKMRLRCDKELHRLAS
jgi:RNA polymerase sigma factor (sigma-70 family)